jgi:hypothetical protein
VVAVQQMQNGRSGSATVLQCRIQCLWRGLEPAHEFAEQSRRVPVRIGSSQRKGSKGVSAPQGSGSNRDDLGLDVADLEGWLNDDDELEELSAVSITRLRIVARDAGIARRKLSTVRL